MNITIDKQTLNDIYEHATREYPGECCGWIMQSSSGKLAYQPAENLQDKYHRIDPEGYPRTSQDAFLMDTLKLNRAIEASQKEGGKLFSIVHSHIDCGAYFSKEDEVQMSSPDGTGPVYPARCYIVVSIKDKKPAENAVFIYDDQSQQYLPGILQVQ